MKEDDVGLLVFLILMCFILSMVWIETRRKHINYYGKERPEYQGQTKRQNLTREPKAIECPGCGAKNLVVHSVGKCDFCNSLLNYETEAESLPAGFYTVETDIPADTCIEKYKPLNGYAWGVIICLGVIVFKIFQAFKDGQGAVYVYFMSVLFVLCLFVASFIGIFYSLAKYKDHHCELNWVKLMKNIYVWGFIISSIILYTELSVF